jgi:hypothetical protein
MVDFLSLKSCWQELLPPIVKKPSLHARWINTLSYLENCGARKIARCEHPTKVQEEMLKHAAEEFRHAYFLKQQIGKITLEPLTTYGRGHLIGGTAAMHYLHLLDVRTCRYLRQEGMEKEALKQAAYLLVTYAIELRASELYGLYHEVLKKEGSRVSVKSIVLEEEEHLNEMRSEIEELELGWNHSATVCAIEAELCQKFWSAAQAALQLSH